MKHTSMLKSLAFVVFLIAGFAPAVTDGHEQLIKAKKCPTVVIKGPKKSKATESITYRGVVKNFSGGTPLFKWSFEGAVIARGEGTDVITVDPTTPLVKATLVVENVPEGCQSIRVSSQTEVTLVWMHPPPIASINLFPSFITRSCPAGTRSESCAPAVNEVRVEGNAGFSEEVKVLLFTWSVTAGRLIGKGQTVTWDLTGAANGSHTITLEVDYFGHKMASSATFKIADCSDCKPISP